MSWLSDQISGSVVSNSLQPHESQHARPHCPTPTPGVHWDPHTSSQWCHPAIHRVSDAIQLSHCLPSPCPLVPNPSQQSKSQFSVQHFILEVEKFFFALKKITPYWWKYPINDIYIYTKIGGKNTQTNSRTIAWEMVFHTVLRGVFWSCRGRASAHRNFFKVENTWVKYISW